MVILDRGGPRSQDRPGASVPTARASPCQESIRSLAKKRQEASVLSKEPQSANAGQALSLDIQARREFQARAKGASIRQRFGKKTGGAFLFVPAPRGQRKYERHPAM